MTIAIPTFGRERVLLDTISLLLPLAPSEIIVVDQTAQHDPATSRQLAEWDAAQAIRWIRLDEPSIPRAMNAALLESEEEIVLFLDDDILPGPNLLEAHIRAHLAHSDASAVIGQVLQPGETPTPPRREFRFSSDTPRWIDSAMAGNMSVKRRFAVDVGGFDENFVDVAYHFETEFAERIIRAGGKVLFEPGASIRHLRAERGGTRAHGHHLTTASPAHSVGAYYHLILKHGVTGAIPGATHRLVGSVATRHHMRQPWWIPVTLFAELRGLAKGVQLFRSGQKLLKP